MSSQTEKMMKRLEERSAQWAYNVARAVAQKKADETGKPVELTFDNGRPAETIQPSLVEPTFRTARIQVGDIDAFDNAFRNAVKDLGE